MKKTILAVVAVVGLALVASASEAVMWTITTGTNAAAAVTKQANPFVGEIDSIAVYTDAGVTGEVAVVATDPYSGAALVLGTNAAVTGYVVWTPRMAEADVGGSTVRVVTNTPTADRFFAFGESVSATVRGASATNATFRITIKVR